MNINPDISPIFFGCFSITLLRLFLIYKLSLATNEYSASINTISKIQNKLVLLSVSLKNNTMRQMKHLYLFVTLIFTFHGTFGGSVSRTMINGGEDATEGEFPYIISIRRIEGFRHMCAGVLIDPEWVLTSAFCVAEYNRPYTVRISLSIFARLHRF